MKLWSYIQGSRKGKEAHRIEKEAMRDPLLADALEGYEKVKGNHRQTVEQLQAKIAARSKRKQNSYFKAWSIAASVLLVVSLGTWFLVNELQTTEDFYSVNRPIRKEQKTPDKEPGITRAENDSAKAPQDRIEETSERKPPRREIPYSPVPAAVVMEEAIAIDTPVQQAETILSLKIPSEESVTDAVAHINDSLPIKPKENIAGAFQGRIRGVSSSKEKKSQSIVKGQVFDKSGEPIVGAVISVSGTNQGTVSDTDGHFALATNDGKKLKVSYIGYEPLTLPADTSKMMLIAMNEDQRSLDEVVVVGFGTQKKEYFAEKPTPAIGKKAYNEYLKNNLVRPTDDECREAEGTVTLTFYVNAKGRPYNIAVKKGLCPSADQEAIRLVNEGPDWKNGEGEVSVKVKF